MRWGRDLGITLEWIWHFPLEGVPILKVEDFSEAGEKEAGKSGSSTQQKTQLNLSGKGTVSKKQLGEAEGTGSGVSVPGLNPGSCT